MSAHEVMAGLVLTQLVLCSPSAQLILKAQHFPQMPERHCFLIIVYLSYKLCLRDCLRPPIRISEQRKDFIYKRTCFFYLFFFFTWMWRSCWPSNGTVQPWPAHGSQPITSISISASWRLALKVELKIWRPQNRHRTWPWFLSGLDSY